MGRGRVPASCINMRTLPVIFSRNQFPALLSFQGLSGVGVEIGALRGDYSAIILKGSNLRKLYSVDSWKEYQSGLYQDINNMPQGVHDHNRRVAEGALREFGPRSEILWMTSQEAADRFEDASLDFIYIDANHSYEECRRDISLWWPKCRQGGFFSGDDFLPDGIYEQGVFGVQSAVLELCREMHQEVRVTKDLWPSWWILKQ